MPPMLDLTWIDRHDTAPREMALVQPPLRFVSSSPDYHHALSLQIGVLLTVEAHIVRAWEGDFGRIMVAELERDDAEQQFSAHLMALGAPEAEVMVYLATLRAVEAQDTREWLEAD